jgi:uncharacterized OB-fold protein
MTVRAARCTECHRTSFPPRLVCRCGRRAFVNTILSEGVVESLTRLRTDGREPQNGAVVLASVRTPEGATVIARADPRLIARQPVRIDFEADALWARPIPI